MTSEKEVRRVGNIYGFEVLEANDGITIQQTTDLDDEMQAIYIDWETLPLLIKMLQKAQSLNYDRSITT
jgi:hypothetical protein